MKNPISKFASAAKLLLVAATVSIALVARPQTPVEKPLADYQSLVVNQSVKDVDILTVLTNVTQGETVTINGKVFEAVTNASALTASTNIPVVAGVPGSTVINSNLFVTSLKNTLNTNTTYTGVTASCSTPLTNNLVITALGDGNRKIVVSETLAGIGNAWASNNTYSGVGYVGSIKKYKLAKRTPTAAEVTAGVMSFGFNFTPVNFTVQVRTSAGVFKAYDGAATIVANNIQLDNSGSTDWAATDTVTINASE